MPYLRPKKNWTSYPTYCKAKNFMPCSKSTILLWTEYVMIGVAPQYCRALCKSHWMSWKFCYPESLLAIRPSNYFNCCKILIYRYVKKLSLVNIFIKFYSLNILIKLFHLQGLLCAHDAVAQKDYLPRLPDIPQEMDEDEETIKIVQLVKSTEPLVLICS